MPAGTTFLQQHKVVLASANWKEKKELMYVVKEDKKEKKINKAADTTDTKKRRNSLQIIRVNKWAQ